MLVASLRRELASLLDGGGYRLVPIINAHALSVDISDVRVAQIPAGVYGPNMSIPTEPLPTLAVDVNVLVRADVPNFVVRAFTEALFTHHVRSMARLPTLNEVCARDEADLTLHPGAESYYLRNAPLRADQFEIAAFGLAALVTLLSAGRWIFLWLRARKLGVEREAVGDILKAIDEASSRAPNDEEQTVVDLLREAQRRWLAGQIDDIELRTIFDAAAAYGGHIRSEKNK